MPLNPVASPGFRILKGETLGYIVWSNTAVTLRAVFRVIYDDGTEDVFITDERSTGSTRAAVLVTSGQHRAKMAGMVVTGSIQTVGVGVPQRGQTYVQALIGSDPAFSSAATVLFQGYMYAGAALLLGVYIEPGPAGGHGMMQSLNLPAPGAGIQYANTSVPVGAIWYIHSFDADVTAFTAAAKSFSLEAFLATSIVSLGQSATFTPAAAAGEISGVAGSGTTFLDTVINRIVFSMDSGRIYLFSNTGNQPSITSTLNGIVAGDTLGVGTLWIEEWVMPN